MQERGNDVVIPDGSFRLQAGDKLYVTASSGDLARLIRSLHLNQKKIKNVMIIGGSRIAVYLAMALLDEGVDVKLIENPKARVQAAGGAAAQGYGDFCRFSFRLTPFWIGNLTRQN